ncbi:hypothetical protein AL036_17315 [Salipiger aestuarii]|uniref:Uncharacterized protein n=1 Tax=Salipiger aestuarii TaxID=568098 RepID=A0A327XY18_9RHOB|nr:hypothetical protein [Salipiger aestuarii]EIE52857.1 hypothetical protein C357_01470 [Citreicella sp. 357]KAA8605771.1 hypothetical protein AL036_17315 [Salipiger aestuarii]KAA8608268.1 hypothetical protein AL037_17210 [Salipiger aestuarii]KAB2540553.1 hypothetical protein AL035_16935 [Salipiger aestuarii]RAK11019.1 hypothetical protein ATI53_105229 [Salipiger aestuarii]
MIYAIQARIHYTVRRTLGSALGGFLMVIGAGFLTVAAWIALVDAYDALTAALGIGAGFILLGVLVIAVSRRRQAYVPPPAAGLGPLIEAFLAGRAAGTSMRTGKSEPD